MPGDRDWRKYNEALVRRGELDIDPSVLEDWGRELRRANGGKVGEPHSHHYPESFMGLLAFLYSGSSSTRPNGDEGVHIQYIHRADPSPPAGGRPGRGRWAARRGVVQHSTYFQCAARPRRSRSARRDREGPPLKAPVHGMDPAGAFWKSPRPGLGALAPSGGHSGPGTNPFRRTAPHFLAVTLIVATILSGSILSSRSWLPVRFVHASTSGLNP